MSKEKTTLKSDRLPWYQRDLEEREWPDEDDDVRTKRAQYRLADWAVYLEAKRSLEAGGDVCAEGEVW